MKECDFLRLIERNNLELCQIPKLVGKRMGHFNGQERLLHRGIENSCSLL